MFQHIPNGAVLTVMRGVAAILSQQWMLGVYKERTVGIP